MQYIPQNIEKVNLVPFQKWSSSVFQITNLLIQFHLVLLRVTHLFPWPPSIYYKFMRQYNTIWLNLSPLCIASICHLIWAYSMKDWGTTCHVKCCYCTYKLPPNTCNKHLKNVVEWSKMWDVSCSLCNSRNNLFSFKTNFQYQLHPLWVTISYEWN